MLFSGGGSTSASFIWDEASVGVEEAKEAVNDGSKVSKHIG